MKDILFVNETIYILLKLINNEKDFIISDIYIEKLNIKNKYDEKEIIFKFSNFWAKNCSKNEAFANMKIVGKKIALELINTYPKVDLERIFYTTLEKFGFSKEQSICEKNAFHSNCVFYDALQKNGFDPTEHTVCWLEWGFIEGFINFFKGVNTIKWSVRDIENQKCKYTF